MKLFSYLGSAVNKKGCQ